MYLDTVDWATSKPSINSSPTMSATAIARAARVRESRPDGIFGKDNPMARERDSHMLSTVDAAVRIIHFDYYFCDRVGGT